jgi:hypothetical protein
MRKPFSSARKVNFEFERRRSSGWMGVALAAVGALATAAVVQEYVDASQCLSVWQAKIADVRRMSQRAPGAIAEVTRDPAQLRQEIRVANVVLHQIALPWDELFLELERSRDKSVALLSVQPDLQSRVVRIGGEAKNLRAVVEYARRLGKTGLLHDAYLVGHEVKTQDPQRPVTFTLVAGWR